MEALEEGLEGGSSVGGLRGLSEPRWMVAEIGGEMSMFLRLGLYLGGGV